MGNEVSRSFRGAALLVVVQWGMYKFLLAILILLSPSLVAIAPAAAHVNTAAHCEFGSFNDRSNGYHWVTVSGGNHIDCVYIGTVYCYFDFWGQRTYSASQTSWYVKKGNGISYTRRSRCPSYHTAYWTQTSGYAR